MDDKINHPSHYGGDTTYEAIKVIEAWDLGFCTGNAVKYIARLGKKPGAKELEDLKKARWYLDREITRMESASKKQVLQTEAKTVLDVPLGYQGQRADVLRAVQRGEIIGSRKGKNLSKSR